MLWSIICLGFSSGLRAAEDEIQTLTDLPPLIYEWHPYEPVTLAVKDELILFGDVDDFGGGIYTFIWQSDRGFIETQTVEVTSSDWINFKSRITYRPTPRDVGTRTITLTVQDPDGHVDARTYVVNVTRPHGSKQVGTAANNRVRCRDAIPSVVSKRKGVWTDTGPVSSESRGMTRGCQTLIM